MSSLTAIRDTDHAIAVLDDWLRSQDYTRASREGIADHVREHGTLEGTVPRWLDREHYETAEAVFCEALPPVPQCSDDWDVEGYWTPSDTFRIAPPELDDIDVPDAPDFYVTRRPGYAESLAADGIALLPISGGSPDVERFEPTAEDWADYREWSSSLAVKRWLAENPSFEAWLDSQGGPRS